MFLMQVDTKFGHGYLSTACFHEQHLECNLECNFCATPCLCQCHWKNNRIVIQRKLLEELGDKAEFVSA